MENSENIENSEKIENTEKIEKRTSSHLQIFKHGNYLRVPV